MPLIMKPTDLGAAPTISNVILEFLREAITSGQLDEGEPIRQDEVAKMFNVSKIPVREALKRLEAEGLVAFQTHKGAVVTSMTEPEIIEIFEVRAILESNAIKMSVPNMTRSTLSRAEGFCDRFISERDVARWAELNWKFHSSLYHDAARPFLLNLIRSVNDRIERYLRIQLTLSHGMEVADHEHRQILDLCRKGDAVGASQLVHHHIMHACESLLESLPAKQRVISRKTTVRRTQHELKRDTVNIPAMGPRNLADSAGTKPGRPPKLSEEQRQEALARKRAGERHSDIARIFSVSPQTIQRLRP